MAFNIYMCGVGGQGIGMLSEILLRAADHAGFRVKAVDTHGLAQRGGMVVSHLRIGEAVFSPLIREGQADLVIGLEIHETFRAIHRWSKAGSTAIYYRASWQPLSVRLGGVPSSPDVAMRDVIERKQLRMLPVEMPGLQKSRMQNMAVLGQIDRHQLIPGVRTDHYLSAMDDLMEGKMLAENRMVFDQAAAMA
jgi:indolepyruvate ferredoxin oxidoreductase beta subunit